jgi:hypothetical protein
MAITVTEDLLESRPELIREGAVYRDTRVFLVKGLEEYAADVKKARALFASGIPAAFEAHPASGLNIFALRHRVRLRDSGIADVIVEYGIPTPASEPPDPDAPPTVEVGGTIETGETEIDTAGKVIWTKHSTEPNAEPITTSVEYPVAMHVLRGTRRELGPVDAIHQRSLQYKGRINKLPIGGEWAHAWFCAVLDGVTRDNGLTFDVTYELQLAPWKPKELPGQPVDNALRERTWDAIVVEKKEDGRPVDDPIWGAGIRKVQIIDDVDFEPLGLF